MSEERLFEYYRHDGPGAGLGIRAVDESGKIKTTDEPLKIFAVGRLSGDPGEWNSPGSLAIVVARTSDEAEELTDVPGSAFEISANQPYVLCENHWQPEF